MAEFILSGFSDEIASDFKEQLDTIKKTKLKFIELRNANGKNISDHTLEEVKDLKKVLDEYGIGVSAVGSPIGKISINDPFEPHLEKFKHTVEIAKLLDTKYIRLFSFFIPKDENPLDYKEKVLSQYNAFCEATKGSGITILHENEKGIFGENVDNCVTIMENCDLSVSAAIFDPANFIQAKQETYPSGYNKLKKYVKYLHIKDCKACDNSITVVGEGDGKIKEILLALMEDNYSGFLSLEPHLMTGDIAVGGDELFMRAHDALVNMLDEIGANYR